VFLRLVVPIAVIVLLLLALRWFRRTPPERVAAILRRTALYGAIGLILVLVATGRLPWLLGVIGAAVPVVLRVAALVQAFPVLKRVARALGLGAVGGRPDGEDSSTSSIRTRFLSMSLDHQSGSLDGTVLEGRFRGRRLSELTQDQIVDLLLTCRTGDPDSAAILEAYLDRYHGDDWRAQGAGTGGAGESRSASVGMTTDEAWAILGLAPGASEDEVRAAHRRLMQKFHPDRGGSDFLAAKINEAKDFLLRKR